MGNICSTVKFSEWVTNLWIPTSSNRQQLYIFLQHKKRIEIRMWISLNSPRLANYAILKHFVATVSEKLPSVKCQQASLLATWRTTIGVFHHSQIIIFSTSHQIQFQYSACKQNLLVFNLEMIGNDSGKQIWWCQDCFYDSTSSLWFSETSWSVWPTYEWVLSLWCDARWTNPSWYSYKMDMIGNRSKDISSITHQTEAAKLKHK